MLCVHVHVRKRLCCGHVPVEVIHIHIHIHIYIYIYILYIYIYIDMAAYTYESIGFSPVLSHVFTMIDIKTTLKQ